MSRPPRSATLYFALLVLWTVVTTPAQGQKDAPAGSKSTPTFAYDWPSGRGDSPGLLRSGATLRFTVETPNTFCFDYRLASKDFRSSLTIPDATKLFAGTLIGQSAVPATGKSPDKSDPGTTSGGGNRPSSLSFNGMVLTAAAKNSIDLQLDAIDADLVAVETGLAEAVKKINVVAGLQERLEKRVSGLYTTACPSGSRGATVATTEVDAVTETTDSLVKKLPVVGEADTAVTSALARLAKVAKQIDALPAEMTPPQAVRAANAKGRTEQSRSLANSFKDKALGEARKLDAAVLTERAALITRRRAPQSVTREFPITENSDSLIVTLRAAGHAEIPTMKGVTIEESFVFHVHRRSRLFLSTGFLMSFFADHEYARVNRSAGVAAHPDSVYSTIVDRRDGNKIGFSPTVLANISVYDFTGTASLFATMGVAARQVNGTIGPDFLLGVSVGISDAFLISAVLQWGRAEKLLLGDAAKVAMQPVPSSITPEQSVGVQWGLGGGLVASLRLP